MGNCCHRIFSKSSSDLRHPLQTETEVKTNFPINPLLHSIERQIPQLPTVPDFTKNPTQFGPRLVLRELVSPEYIINLENYFFEEIEHHKPTLTKITEASSEEIFDAEYFVENLGKETGFELINVLFQNYKSNFKADFMLFSYLNQMVYLYPHVDDYELVQFEGYSDTIFLIERLRTERILIISQRNMLVLRVIRRFGNDKFLDVSQSIEFHMIREFPTLKELWENKIKDDPASPFIVGNYFENRGTYCYVCSFSKVDFHFSIPLKFTTIFLRRSFISFVEKLSENLQAHFKGDAWNSGMNLLWFKNDNTREFIVPSFVKDKENAMFFADISEFLDELKKPAIKNSENAIASELKKTG